MKRFENVKSIGLKIRLEGMGCVNYDSNEIRFALAKCNFVHIAKDSSNYKFAKREFMTDSEGNPAFKYKVSSECLGRAMFEKEIPGENQAISSVPSVLYSAIANWAFISRGYMFTRNNKPTIKKKGCVTICDAVEVGEPRTHINLEIHSNKSSKVSSGKEDDAKGSTSMFNQENVGKLTYESTGFIDLGELQFISDDPTYDRICLSLFDECPEKKIFMNTLAQNFPSMEGKDFGYYYSEGSFSKDEWGERGVLLTKDAVNAITHKIIKSIIDLQIVRRHACLGTTSIVLEVVTSNGKEEIEITKDFLLDDLYFAYMEKYIESDDDKIKANKIAFDNYAKESKSSKKKDVKKSEKQDEFQPENK